MAVQINRRSGHFSSWCALPNVPSHSCSLAVFAPGEVVDQRARIDLLQQALGRPVALAQRELDGEQLSRRTAQREL